MPALEYTMPSQVLRNGLTQPQHLAMMQPGQPTHLKLHSAILTINQMVPASRFSSPPPVSRLTRFQAPDQEDAPAVEVATYAMQPTAMVSMLTSKSNNQPKIAGESALAKTISAITTDLIAPMYLVP